MDIDSIYEKLITNELSEEEKIEYLNKLKKDKEQTINILTTLSISTFITGTGIGLMVPTTEEGIGLGITLILIGAIIPLKTALKRKAYHMSCQKTKTKIKKL